MVEEKLDDEAWAARRKKLAVEVVRRVIGSLERQTAGNFRRLMLSESIARAWLWLWLGL